MSLDREIVELRSKFLSELKSIESTKEIENLKVLYLGKKGPVQALMRNLKDATNEERPLFGKLINDLKQELSAHLENTHSRLFREEQNRRLESERIDITLPGKKSFLGRKHPITLMLEKAIDILSQMGFSVALGPDIDTDFYNFGALNFPEDHPARDMQDTFYLSDVLLLRTHTSNVQVRIMETMKPPIRIIAPGKCFRNETISCRSHVFFHQIEGFYIDENVSFPDLMTTMEEFWKRLLGSEIELRFRPSYFPFVEPGLEVDLRLKNSTKWLEVAGAGMIHPEVLKSGGIDAEKYTGYAWGLGIERLAMIEYGVKDIRMFSENDVRFLNQF